MNHKALFRTLARSIAAVCFSALLPSPAVAQQSPYPVKPIHMVVPFGAGSVTDTLARIIATRLSEAWGQPVVVDNRAGADGNIGTGYVAAAERDGYTLLFGAASTNAINASLHTNLKFDPQRDFVPVVNVASVPNVLVVPPSVSARSVKELLALLHKQQYSYASGGAGGSQHLSAELFKSMSKTDILHVPYKGGAPALTDLLAGRVQMMFCNLPLCLPHIRSGKLIALGVTSARKSPLLPNVPTISESGLPGYVVEGWFGMFAPAGVPKQVVSRINAEVVRILKDPKTREQLLAQGAEPVGDSPEGFAVFVGKEHDRWAAVIRNAGITVN